MALLPCLQCQLCHDCYEVCTVNSGHSPSPNEQLALHFSTCHRDLLRIKKCFSEATSLTHVTLLQPYLTVFTCAKDKMTHFVSTRFTIYID